MAKKSKARITEERRFVRLPREFVLELSELVMSKEAAEFIVARILNISASGILLESERDFPLGSLLKLKIKIDTWEKFLPGFKKFDQSSLSAPFKAIGQVIRKDESAEESGKFLLGVDLKNVDESHRVAVNKYIENQATAVKA